MLDPATVQILFADLQPPIVARSKTNPPQSLSCAASVLARCARLLGLPVHHSVVPEGGKAPEVLPDLAIEGAPQFARMTADPFLDPHTREAIDAVKRPVLVIAGFATEAVVFHAALSALESGYQVQVPVDACGGLSARTEDAARFETTFGKAGAAVLVRPDGYAGLTSPISSAADHLAAYRRKWFSASAADARS